MSYQPAGSRIGHVDALPTVPAALDGKKLEAERDPYRAPFGERNDFQVDAITGRLVNVVFEVLIVHHDVNAPPAELGRSPRFANSDFQAIRQLRVQRGM